jgi:hypothetical protein
MDEIELLKRMNVLKSQAIALLVEEVKSLKSKGISEVNNGVMVELAKPDEIPAHKSF